MKYYCSKCKTVAEITKEKKIIKKCNCINAPIIVELQATVYNHSKIK